MEFLEKYLTPQERKYAAESAAAIILAAKEHGQT